MFLNKFSDFYKKFEKWISPVGLIYGFIFTSLTLTRVDMWLENFWIILHLLIAGFGILAMTMFENRAEKDNSLKEDKNKFHFYLTLLIQFAFGGLFSTFFIFYMRSSSLTDSWLFLVIILMLVIGNELWKKHYQKLTFQISILFISVYLFLVFLLPVIFHRLGSDLFIYAGLSSLIITFFFTLLLRKFSQEKFQKSHNLLKISLIGIFVLMNVLYFTDIIPPIPLSLKEAGIYHNIIRDNEGNYLVKAEPSVWQDYFNRYPVFHIRIGEKAYAFSAVFSPIKFNTNIIHQWQYYDEIKKDWVDYTRVVLPITGGREDGFRTYSASSLLKTGLWRVRVMTASGQTLGNVNFKVEKSITEPNLIIKTF